MKYMDIKEFCELGLLHEVNRQFFHPLGLALVVGEEDDGTQSIIGVWDNRDDPEGICFADETLSAAKAQSVKDLEDARREARQASLGYWVQPV